ncbi:hypothetical protein T552_01781 [Pneumocystis carinii B80]|uniref:Uncharacterized protein n=1 Tax=Pneumocystis carinii (strain B80) TaxID=1408658 RepID=A0A0W4ZJH3_PNEC8|nr:hypothetical protein T552_01781 [Pneumocystis carinii B80]KTW28522.1 hypothetical protein T552_01781 [Pneumocystis carinii B80]
MAKRHTKAAEKIARILSGPGAFKLPSDIHGLTLFMAFKNKDGHMGPRQVVFILFSILINNRKFWKDYLPSVQFHNPYLHIQVCRSHEEKDAKLKIHQKLGDMEIDMKHKDASEICREFVEKTRAVEVGKEEIKEIMENSKMKG